MIEYTKIDTLFERDMEGTKKLIEGEYRNKTVEFLLRCLAEKSTRNCSSRGSAKCR